MGMQVTDPRGILDESHAEALQTAATLFSLEAGGPENGATLDAMPIMPSFRGRGSFAPSHRGGGRFVAPQSPSPLTVPLCPAHTILG